MPNIMQKQVAEFHRIFGHPIFSEPTSILEDRRTLRVALILEEAEEIAKAAAENNMVEMADGLADLLYVVFGAALEMGIDLERVFDEVHRSNMTKLWSKDDLHLLGEDQVAESCIYHGEERYIVRNLMGKIIKSPSYSPAKIGTVLNTQSITVY